MVPLYFVKVESWSQKCNWRYALTAPDRETAERMACHESPADDAKVVATRFLGHINAEDMQELP